MRAEIENMWDAVKDLHYNRTLQSLRANMRNAQDLQEGLTISLDLMVTASHAVGGTFWVYDKYRDGRIRPKAVYGGADLGGITLMPGEGIAGQVIQQGNAVIVEDCQKDPRWAGRVDGQTGFKTESMICVPLQVEDTIFGCIQIINKTGNVLFDESDLQFAKGFAEYASGLFQENGFLEEYRAGQALERGRSLESTFMQIFGAQSAREMEVHLRRVEDFSRLRASEQREVLDLAKQMYVYFAPKRKSRLGGIFRR
ncbi:MAG: GAF domain-containing protein [Eubacteriales bacterium]